MSESLASLIEDSIFPGLHTLRCWEGEGEGGTLGTRLLTVYTCCRPDWRAVGGGGRGGGRRGRRGRGRTLGTRLLTVYTCCRPDWRAVGGRGRGRRGRGRRGGRRGRGRTLGTRLLTVYTCCRPDWRAVGYTRNIGSYPSHSERASAGVEPCSSTTGTLTYHQHQLQLIIFSGSRSLSFQRSTGSPTPSIATTDFAKRAFSTNQAGFFVSQRPTASPTPNWRTPWTKYTKVHQHQ